MVALLKILKIKCKRKHNLFLVYDVYVSKSDYRPQNQVRKRKKIVRSIKMAPLKKFIDIGSNLTDLMYQGLYHGSRKHEPDLNDVLKRSWDNGLQKLLITGGSLEDSRKALELAHTDDKLFSTAGVHPTRSSEPKASGDVKGYMDALVNLIKENSNKIVALGECGLDYDRLHFASKEDQNEIFDMQLKLAQDIRLPLFLHCRAAATDVLMLLKRHQSAVELCGGVVHSFDGSVEEAKSFMDLGLYIGLNGCSLKTAQNLEVLKTLPRDRILIETDCPYCEIKATHAGYKLIQTTIPSVKKEKWQKNAVIKGRTEPSHIVQVLEIVAAVRGEEPTQLADTIYENTVKLFFNKS